jgi:hypothetical protein
MSMRGITDFFKPDEAVELAVLAGNDILVMPGDVQTAVNTVSRMIRRGMVSEEDINRRCRKILLAKYWCGLNNYKPVETENLNADLNRDEYQLLRRKLIESSVTIVENRNRLIPFMHLDTLRIASLSFGMTNDSAFQKTLALYAPVSSFFIPGQIKGQKHLIDTAANCGNLLIVSVHANDISAARNYGISDDIIRVVDSLATKKKIVLNIFGNPYLLNRFSNLSCFQSVVISYENSSAIQDITAQMLFGAIGISGVMPVEAGSWAFPTGSAVRPLG